jgi:hypothetical protein
VREVRVQDDDRVVGCGARPVEDRPRERAPASAADDAKPDRQRARRELSGVGGPVLGRIVDDENLRGAGEPLQRDAERGEESGKIESLPVGREDDRYAVALPSLCSLSLLPLSAPSLCSLSLVPLSASRTAMITSSSNLWAFERRGERRLIGREGS